jgi:cell division cycle 14
MPYASDFGPLDLGCVYKFCCHLDQLLTDSRYSHHSIYHYTSLIPAKRANAALLMGAYQVIRLERTAEEAWEYFENTNRFIPFRDASSEGSPFELYILDCLKGLEKAIKLAWFDFNSFNLQEYETMSYVENGGLNWIVPKKILAFSAPSPDKKVKGEAMSPEDYGFLFRDIGVNTVVRLNKEHYDCSKITQHGIRFHDLYFLDGSVPADDIVEEFIRICNDNKSVVAVHCKAGLGRTGTLIGCWAIRNFGFTGPEFIGWARLCRPGSVLGPQQFFLCEFAERASYLKASKGADILRAKSPQAPSRGEMTLFEKYKAKFGEMGQSDKLTQVMNSAPSSPVNLPPHLSKPIGIRIPPGAALRNFIKQQERK